MRIRFASNSTKPLPLTTALPASVNFELPPLVRLGNSDVYLPPHWIYWLARAEAQHRLAQAAMQAQFQRCCRMSSN